MIATLAELVAKASEKTTISPRTTVHALDLARASAVLNGREHVAKDDLVALRFLPGMEAISANIRAELDAAVTRAEAEDRLADFHRQLAEVEEEYGGARSMPQMMRSAARFSRIFDRLSALTVPEGLSARRNELRDAADAKRTEAQQKALAETHI
jgi:hypothetical protein